MQSKDTSHRPRQTTSLPVTTVPFHPVPVGIQNIGNTCYANTTFQCLLHTHGLTSFVIRRSYEKFITPRAKVVDAAIPSTLTNGCRKELNIHPTTGTPSAYLLELYRKFLEDMRRRKVESRTEQEKLTRKHQPPYNPTELMRAVAQASTYRTQQGESTTPFLIGQQHDLAEFLQFMLDMLHDTAQLQIQLDVSGTVANLHDQMLVDSFQQLEKHYGDQYSYVTDMMTGQYFVQSKTCDIRVPTEHCETYDPFTMLTLDLPVGRRECTLHDCFDLMVQPEIIEGWKGELTDHPRVIERKTYLWRLPDILIIQLKRFANQYVKNSCSVRFEPTLDLRNYCLGSDVNSMRFELYAIANHEGTLHFGHYYADCKKNDGLWYRFNDTHVSKIQSTDLREDAAYVLFYRRIGGSIVNG